MKKALCILTLVALCGCQQLYYKCGASAVTAQQSAVAEVDAYIDNYFMLDIDKHPEVPALHRMAFKNDAATLKKAIAVELTKMRVRHDQLVDSAKEE